MSQLWQNTFSQARTVYGEYGEMMGAPCTPCSESSPTINACDPDQSLDEYGRLYNWYAVTDNRGLCPSGWVVPNNAQWDGLLDYVSGEGFQTGSALKSQAGWAQHVNSDGVAEDGNGEDVFGFGALPGGVRGENGNFSGAGSNGQWWSRTPFDFLPIAIASRPAGRRCSRRLLTGVGGLRCGVFSLLIDPPATRAH